MSIETESRTALREFINLLEEVDQRWAGEEWNLFSPEDVTGAHRSLPAAERRAADDAPDRRRCRHHVRK